MDNTLRSEALDNLFRKYDPFAHLDAIHDMLQTLARWNDYFGKRVKQVSSVLESSRTLDLNSLLWGDEYVDACQQSVFADGAYSNAVIGALAPLFEGVYNHEFSVLRRIDAIVPMNRLSHRRGKLTPEVFWNPYLHVDKKDKLKGLDDITNRNIHAGSQQILKSLNVMDRFPAHFSAVTKAVFTFRNKALHLGLEWPVAERQWLVEQIQSKDNPDWNDWFLFSKENGTPWIVSLSDEFVEVAFTTAVETVKAFERLWLERLMTVPEREPIPQWMQNTAKDECYRPSFEDCLMSRTYGPIRPKLNEDAQPS